MERLNNSAFLVSPMSSTDSPCIDYCVYNYEEDCCEGCGRNLLEISVWGKYSEDEKAAITKTRSIRLEKITMTKFEKKVTSTINKINTGCPTEKRKAWMEVISEREVAIEVLKRLTPEMKDELTEAIRSAGTR